MWDEDIDAAVPIMTFCGEPGQFLRLTCPCFGLLPCRQLTSAVILGLCPCPPPLPFQNNHVEQVTFRRRERDCLVWRLRDDKGLSRELFCITGVAVLGADVRQLQRRLQANPEDK